MPQYVAVGGSPASCPMWSLAPISPAGIKTESSNDEKDVAVRSINGNPVSRSSFAILPKLVRRIWCPQPSDRVQYIRGRPGAIVSRIEKGRVSSSIPVWPANDLISCSNRLLHCWRCLCRSNRIPKLGSSRTARNVVIDVRCSGLTTRQNQNQTKPTKNSTKGKHGGENATNRTRNSRS